MTVETSDYPAAYLVTFHTYGSWLHGDKNGSIDRKHNRYGSDFQGPDSKRRDAMRTRMKEPEVLLSSTQRSCIETAIRGVSDHRGWDLLALNVRTNHVHAVVASAAEPERVMNDFKSWATRRLREAALIDKSERVWSRHGSTRYLWNDRSVDNACRYVIEGQGAELD